VGSRNSTGLPEGLRRH